MNALSAALYAKLKAGTALTSLLSDGTAGIFEDHASETADLPYVIFNQQSGQWSETMGERTRFATITYQVKAVSGSAWPKEAETIDTQIDALLHAGTMSVTGYGLMRMVRESDIRYSEEDGNQTFQHVGALYRLDVQKT